MPTHLISLTGGQPIPNLLPARFLQPEQALFVHSERSRPTAVRLQRLLAAHCQRVDLLQVDPYDYAAIRQALRSRLQAARAAGEQVIFNLTDGAKIMTLSAFSLAAEHSLPFIYMQTKGCRNLLYRYEFHHAEAVLTNCCEIPPVISLADYLNAHLDGFSVEGCKRDEHGQLDAGGRFEDAIYRALLPRLDEVLAGVRPASVARQIDIDLAVRLGNQAGVIETKTGSDKNSGKRGLGQLKIAAEADFLGAFTAQFLVSSAPLRENLRTLAGERHVRLIAVPEYRDGEPLPPAAAERIADEIIQRLSE